MRASPSTAALRFSLARLAIGATMSPPEEGAFGDLWRVTPARLAIVCISLLEVGARLGLLAHAIARRDRPLRGLVLPCAVGGVAPRVPMRVTDGVTDASR
jgi:hypothetical protein